MISTILEIFVLLSLTFETCILHFLLRFICNFTNVDHYTNSYQPLKRIRTEQITIYTWIRPVTSLEHQEGRRVFWEGPQAFELCPIVLNDVQHIFPGEEKNFSGAASPPLITGLTWTMVRRASCGRNAK